MHCDTSILRSAMRRLLHTSHACVLELPVIQLVHSHMMEGTWCWCLSKLMLILQLPVNTLHPLADSPLSVQRGTWKRGRRLAVKSRFSAFKDAPQLLSFQFAIIMLRTCHEAVNQKRSKLNAQAKIWLTRQSDLGPIPSLTYVHFIYVTDLNR